MTIQNWFDLARFKKDLESSFIDKLNKFKSLKARKKQALSAMNFKSININLLYAPIFNLISYKSIGIIKKGAPCC